MRKVTKAAAAAMVLLAGGAMRAQAADMLPPAYQLESDAMVEFGSGWYLRGDIGYSTVSAPLGSPPVQVSGNSGYGYSLRSATGVEHSEQPQRQFRRDERIARRRLSIQSLVPHGRDL